MESYYNESEYMNIKAVLEIRLLEIRMKYIQVVIYHLMYLMKMKQNHY